MIRVAAYIKGIPRNNTKVEKEEVLRYFIEGVNVCGDFGFVVDHSNYVESDVSVIQGFISPSSKNLPHLNLRKSIIENCKKNSTRFICIDSNVFLYKSPDNPKKYLRFSFDGVFPNTADYCNNNSDGTQWKKIQEDFNIELKPWKFSGEYILLCLQRSGGWSMKGQSVVKWAMSVVKRVRQQTTMKIVVRPHPGDKKSARIASIIAKEKNVVVSKEKDLSVELKNAYATIVFNSSPAVASAIEGVPVFVDDIEACQARQVAHSKLSELLTPREFDRTQWIKDVAQSHWSFEDLKAGIAWKHMRQYL